MGKELIRLQADNVYRTEHYIVTQQITIGHEKYSESFIHSTDIYYVRTKERDELFEEMFSHRYFLDGKRIHTTTYTRVYID